MSVQPFASFGVARVQVDRAGTGGDAAHAMSPAGGVGVNYAIQDAVATANLLAAKLRYGDVCLADLRRVQRRREWPVRLIQAMQATQMATYGRAYRPGADPQRILKLFSAFAPFKRVFGRVVGLGFRREHVRTPDLGNATASLAGVASGGEVRVPPE